MTTLSFWFQGIYEVTRVTLEVAPSGGHIHYANYIKLYKLCKLFVYTI